MATAVEALDANDLGGYFDCLHPASRAVRTQVDAEIRPGNVLAEVLAGPKQPDFDRFAKELQSIIRSEIEAGNYVTSAGSGRRLLAWQALLTSDSTVAAQRRSEFIKERASKIEQLQSLAHFFLTQLDGDPDQIQLKQRGREAAVSPKDESSRWYVYFRWDGQKWWLAGGSHNWNQL